MSMGKDRTRAGADNDGDSDRTAGKAAEATKGETVIAACGDCFTSGGIDGASTEEIENGANDRRYDERFQIADVVDEMGRGTGSDAEALARRRTELADLEAMVGTMPDDSLRRPDGNDTAD